MKPDPAPAIPTFPAADAAVRDKYNVEFDNMNKGIAILLAAAGIAVSAPAAAQDDTSFSGPWVAGVAGYDINKSGSEQLDAGATEQDRNA